MARLYDNAERQRAAETEITVHDDLPDQSSTSAIFALNNRAVIIVPDAQRVPRIYYLNGFAAEWRDFRDEAVVSKSRTITTDPVGVDETDGLAYPAGRRANARIVVGNALPTETRARRLPDGTFYLVTRRDITAPNRLYIMTPDGWMFVA